MEQTQVGRGRARPEDPVAQVCPTRCHGILLGAVKVMLCPPRINDVASGIWSTLAETVQVMPSPSAVGR